MIKITYWSDYVCPFCYIGEIRLLKAIEKLGIADQVELDMRSFELYPDADKDKYYSGVETIAATYGITEEQANAQLESIQQMGLAEGIDFFLKTAKYTNTFDVHRLTKLAYSKGDKRLANRMILSLFDAFFGKNEELNNRDVLIRIAVEAGLDKSEVESVLDGNTFSDEVRKDEADANAFGIRGVPFFVINNKYSISGAQQEDFFVGALGKVLAELNKEKTEEK